MNIGYIFLSDFLIYTVIQRRSKIAEVGQDENSLWSSTVFDPIIKQTLFRCLEPLYNMCFVLRDYI